MISDEMCEEEIFQAYLIYASLYGLSTDETEVRERIERYCSNSPDETVDLAILAYAEDRIVAPPDVVLERWGKSRVYDLKELPDGSWRHQVNASWFENDCRYVSGGDARQQTHFWTSFKLEIASDGLQDGSQEPSVDWVTCGLGTGSRLQFRMQHDGVAVWHRRAGRVGELPRPLSQEIIDRAGEQIRYLPLIDKLEPRGDAWFGKTLVSVAGADVLNSQIVEYAARAFSAHRSNC